MTLSIGASVKLNFTVVESVVAGRVVANWGRTAPPAGAGVVAAWVEASVVGAVAGAVAGTSCAEALTARVRRSDDTVAR